jgi:hypothetical protein
VHRGLWFFIDYNGNGRWDKNAGGDRAFRFSQRGAAVVGNWSLGSPLLAADGPAASGAEAGVLTTDLASPLVQQAIDTYSSLPLTASQQRTLERIDVHIADLPGATLGRALGTTITLDSTAASHGWFVDSTPRDNVEFVNRSDASSLAASAGSQAYERVDLLSVIMHELGHVLGRHHEPNGIMEEVLPLSTRRLWDQGYYPVDDGWAVDSPKKGLDGELVDAAFARDTDI